MRVRIKHLCLLFILFLTFSFGCPIFNFFGVTCPACGVTHAWMFLFYGNLYDAFKSNPFFLILTVAFIRIIYCEIKRLKLNKFEYILYLITVILAFIFNLFRIFYTL